MSKKSFKAKKCVFRAKNIKNNYFFSMIVV